MWKYSRTEDTFCKREKPNVLHDSRTTVALTNMPRQGRGSNGTATVSRNDELTSIEEFEDEVEKLLSSTAAVLHEQEVSYGDRIKAGIARRWRRHEERVQETVQRQQPRERVSSTVTTEEKPQLAKSSPTGYGDVLGLSAVAGSSSSSASSLFVGAPRTVLYTPPAVATKSQLPRPSSAAGIRKLSPVAKVVRRRPPIRPSGDDLEGTQEEDVALEIPKERDIVSGMKQRAAAEARSTYDRICAAFEKQLDLTMLPVARVDRIEYESIRSLHQRQQSATAQHAQHEAEEEEEEEKYNRTRTDVSQRTGVAGGGVRSLPSSLAPSVGDPSVDYHSFVSHNARREIIAGTTKNRYHVTKDPAEGCEAHEKAKLQALRYRLRRGILHNGIDLSYASPCAITFSPLVSESANFAASSHVGRNFRTWQRLLNHTKLRCVLFGTLERRHEENPTLGNPYLALPATKTTVTSTTFFEEERRKQMRHEHEARKAADLGVDEVNLDHALAKMTYEAEHPSSSPEPRISFESVAEQSTASEKSASDRAAREHLDATVKLTDHQLLRQITGHELPDSLKRLLDDALKPKPLRHHSQLVDPERTGLTNYKDCHFRPSLLVIYEVANCDPLQLRVKSEEELLRLAAQLKKEQTDSFSPFDFTTRWCSPIGSIEYELRRDAWIRHRMAFPQSFKKQKTSELMSLLELLTVLGNGSLSVDVKDRDEGVQFRHSVTFTNQWTAFAQHQKERN